MNEGNIWMLKILGQVWGDEILITQSKARVSFMFQLISSSFVRNPECVDDLMVKSQLLIPRNTKIFKSDELPIVDP
jgi:hypothetical protein